MINSPAVSKNDSPTDHYRLVENELSEVESIMRRELTRNDPYLDDIVQYGFRLSGKRLRPALLLLCGKTAGNGELSIDHLRAAASVEMIHTGTLIHDDILDGALVRRHLATMNVLWNAEISVLAGDVLFMRALKLMTLSDDLFAYRELAEASHRTCEGELLQIGSRSLFGIGESKYLSIVTEKTGALIESACALGAHFSGGDSVAMQRFRIYGRSLGVAFQIADDVLDLVGHETMTGKTLGTDFAKQKPTLPLIHFLETAPPEQVTTMLSLLEANPTEDSFHKMVEMLHSNGSIEYAGNVANAKILEAKEALDPYSSDAAKSLLAISNTVGIRRKY